MKTRRSKLAACWLGLIVLLMNFAVGIPPVHADGPAPRKFEPAECPFPVPNGLPVQCGYLIVPEDRSKPDGRMIKLAVAIFKSRRASPEPDPVVYLEGGPGGSALASFAMFKQGVFDSILEKRDLIIFDQRGAGFSQPALDCPTFIRQMLKLDTLPGLETSVSNLLEDARQCYTDLASQGIDLSMYNSAASAADVNDLRLALGYKQWNLFGISYGTRLGLTVIRDFPEGVRSLTLDSTLLPQARLNVEALPNMDRALNALFEDCARNLPCSLAYPDLKNVFYRLVDTLNGSPVALLVTLPGAAASQQVLLDGNRLIILIFSLLYEQWTVRLLPALIYDMRDGNDRQLTRLAPYILTSGMVTVGMFLSVECREEAPFNSVDEAGSVASQYPTVLRDAMRLTTIGESGIKLCSAWPVDQPDPIENQPVRSAIPTLILAGRYDPVTPPAWGKAAAGTLSHSYYFEFPEAAHGVVAGGPCPAEIVLTFLNDPNTQPDGGCINTFFFNKLGSGFLIRAETSRPVTGGLALLIGGLAALAAVRIGASVRRHPGQFTWRKSLRLTNQIPAIGAAAAVLLLLALHGAGTPIPPERVVDLIIPLALGIQAALIFSPADEPLLEIGLACPRPLVWTVLERLALALVMQFGIGIAGTLLSLAIVGQGDLGQALWRWLTPALFFAGLGLYVTLASRQPTFGLCVVFILWFALLVGGDQIVNIWPFLWPIHIYLQPDDPLLRDFYALNRLIIGLFGFGFLMLAMRQIRDEEKILSGATNLKQKAGAR